MSRPNLIENYKNAETVITANPPFFAHKMSLHKRMLLLIAGSLGLVFSLMLASLLAFVLYVIFIA